MIGTLLWFIQSVALPAALAIAIVYFVHGFLNHSILGPGDQSRREVGQNNLATANSILIVVLVVYLVIEGIVWSVGTTDGVEFFRSTGLLPVPNTPLEVQDN